MRMTQAQYNKVMELVKRYETPIPHDIDIEASHSETVTFWPKQVGQGLMIVILPDGSSHT